LVFGLVPANYLKVIVESLKKLLERENGHLVTGFVGTPYFCHALSENGCLKEAYDLLMKEDYPSWLFQVNMGATTIWEHWDGIRPDGTMWSPDMNSFNHYAYGAVGEWIYRVCAGIEIDEKKPGYSHIIFQPHIGGKLTFVQGRYESIYGTIRSEWSVNGNEITVAFRVPVNTTATIYLDQCEEMIEADGVEFQPKKGNFIGEVGSGDYQIRVRTNCFQ
jgi:alpha-L-rhamnosidase